MAPAPATRDYGNRTVVNFQRVPGYPFEINMGTQAADYHISDTPIVNLVRSQVYHTLATDEVLEIYFLTVIAASVHRVG